MVPSEAGVAAAEFAANARSSELGTVVEHRAINAWLRREAMGEREIALANHSLLCDVLSATLETRDALTALAQVLTPTKAKK